MTHNSQEAITKTQQQHKNVLSPSAKISLTLVSLLVGSLIVSTVDSPTTSSAANSVQKMRSHGFADKVKSVRPATVNITSATVTTNWQPPNRQEQSREWFNQGSRHRNDFDFFGIPRMPRQPREPFGRGMGSGVIVSPNGYVVCLLYTSPSPRDLSTSRMPSSA